MKRGASNVLVVALLTSLGLAACKPAEQVPAAVPASAAVPGSPASQPASGAAAGPLIAPVAVTRPTDAQRSAGATLASQGAGSVAACAGCHGANGEGNAAAGFPRIAGQSFNYLQRQLQSYAEGTRTHPVMQPIAAAMTPEQRVAAAAHYASIASASASAAASAVAPAASARGETAGARGGRGAQLASVGDNALGVQGCANCHGPGGIGAGEAYPALAGQSAAYFTSVMRAWADGTRRNDPTGTMPLIAKALPAGDIDALAAYYAAQAPRGTPLDAEAMPPAGSSQRAAVTSGPRQAASGAGGASGGSEQGAGLTGGAQGPGGGGATSTPSTNNPAGATAPQPGGSASR